MILVSGGWTIEHFEYAKVIKWQDRISSVAAQYARSIYKMLNGLLDTLIILSGERSCIHHS